MTTKEHIAMLLEKYWQTETTVEEERELAEYFRGVDIPAEWTEYQQLFAFFASEAEIQPSEDLPRRIMQRIHPRRQTLSWWAAAAVIILIIGLIPLLHPNDAPTQKDTYDDPQQALAAVQKALFTVSRNLNKGIQPLK